jgi:DNA-binding transcriptional LysR family regulator
MTKAHDTTTQVFTRMLSRLKVRHLTLLVQIGRLGSLTKVARELATTQPSVTQALAEIEAMFGMPLFARTGRGMTPTPVGQVAVSRAATMLSDLERWAQEMRVVQAGFSAHLHLGIIPFVSGKLVCDALQRSRANNRGLAVTIQESTSDQLLQALHDQTLDCVIARASAVVRIPGLVTEVLYHQSPRLVTNQKLGKRLTAASLDWAKLAELEWILPSPRTPIGAMVMDLFIRAGVKPPVPVIETYSQKILGSMIESSATIVSIVPADIAADLSRTARVVSVPCGLDWALPPVALFRRQDEVTSPALDIFVDVLRSLCKKD